jgi:4-diphosphocytidyl-2-C-methyl-D-erythritol kinase
VSELAAVSDLPLAESAPAKINLGLFVGPLRTQDSRHELATVIQAISLADELTLEWADGGEDEVLCRGFELDGAENLAAVALRLFREATAWEGPPVRLTIEKRIPVAAGLAGGSADAAAMLRLARAASGLGSRELLLELATELGADVPAQLEPGRWLATGAGERLARLPSPGGELGVLLLPAITGLSTGAVFAYGDELGIGRSAGELAEVENELREAFAQGTATPAIGSLLHNDLQEAAVALQPAIEPALAQAREAGVDAAFVSGSGPTVAGLFLSPDGPARARAAAANLAGRRPAALLASFLAARPPTRDIPVRHNHGS